MNEWVVGIVSGVLSGAIVSAVFYTLAGRDLRKKREEVQQASERSLEALSHVLEDFAAAPRMGAQDVKGESNRDRVGKGMKRASMAGTAPTAEIPVQKTDTFTSREEIAERSSGVVKKYFARKGFGFISRPNEPDLFFHRSEVAEHETLSRGDRVEFDMDETEPGKWRAMNVVPRKESG